MQALYSESYEKLLDKVGWEILRELQEDARIPFSELGRRVGLTPPAVAERVRRMEEAGIIAGYQAKINLAAVGLPMLAVMSVRTYANMGGKLFEAVKTIPEVLICHEVTGLECYYMRVAVSSVPHLNKLIKKLSIYGQITTSLILSSPVEGRIISPPEEID